ncbi:MAG TPA: 23S rRNA (pseudouridine(1915)-N(3))-methyltransferase RlmH [Alphaproteobacteria bacterium]|nr:23S rRNA (pseudouridine(1915)-N(3))-methyltransferase RlmH [Alphaproteobacteria bacterium]
MRFRIVAVGRLRDAPSRALFDEYAARLTWPLTVREVELKRPLPPEEAKAEEGRLLLEAVGKDATLVALDERGRDWTSIELARRIGEWRDEGVPDVVFAIGGADGLDPALVRRAVATLAFGRMTWPHRLARVMLVEQLYRAQQILAGHPYHRA